MSKVKIEVTAILGNKFNNRVTVDGNHAYYFNHSIATEVENLRRLIELLEIENTEVIFRDRK